MKVKPVRGHKGLLKMYYVETTQSAIRKKGLFVNLRCLYDWQTASEANKHLFSEWVSVRQTGAPNLLSCITHQSVSRLAIRSSNQSISVSSVHPVSSWFSQPSSQSAWQRAAEESINKTYCTSEGFRSIELFNSSGHQTAHFLASLIFPSFRQLTLTALLFLCSRTSLAPYSGTYIQCLWGFEIREHNFCFWISWIMLKEQLTH